MVLGSVKFFNASKGFGFIVPEIEGNDVFIDKTALHLAGLFELEKGQRLSNEIEQDAKARAEVEVRGNGMRNMRKRQVDLIIIGRTEIEHEWEMIVGPSVPLPAIMKDWCSTQPL